MHIARTSTANGGPARDRERGAAAVELALVLVPLLLILLGIVEFGRVYSQQLSMQYAAREAARTIALEYDDLGMTQALLNINAVSTLTSLLPIDDLSDLTAYDIQLCSTSGGSPTAEVQLQDDLQLAIPFLNAGGGIVPVTAKATMPCEG